MSSTVQDLDQGSRQSSGQDRINVLVYLLRRDLRLSDNPIFHTLSQEGHPFTHLLPIYVFPAQQIEVSGFIDDGTKSPYPEARGQVGNFWRCGPHRAKFLSESVWNLKKRLENMGSGLVIRLGMVGEVARKMLDTDGKMKVGAVWMTGEEGVEEGHEEQDVKKACEDLGVDFKLWVDEKYLVDDRDLPFKDSQELPDIFTTYRKEIEKLNLRTLPRQVLSAPKSLPSLPNSSLIPAQHLPFSVPSSFEETLASLLKPLESSPTITDPPTYPAGTQNSHPFTGGETHAQTRLSHLLSTGAMTNYLNTRNGLLGEDYSSKLSAYLALGCLTSRQIHASLLAFEDGTIASSPKVDTDWPSVPGYGAGPNEGTKHMRFELLWRDYMRLCTRKFTTKLFRLQGFKNAVGSHPWYHPSIPEIPGSSTSSPNDSSNTRDSPSMSTSEKFERFLNGTSGMSLIDASQREVFNTGYTSNRARQNVASFLAHHLWIDWRLGAEYYEYMLVDYDLSSNWGNWQYVSGVGNDPRGSRVFNPVKQGFDYDGKGEYVKAWCEELRGLSDTGEIMQPWTVRSARREGLGLVGVTGIERPLERIDFKVGRGRGGGRGSIRNIGRAGYGNSATGAGSARGNGNERQKFTATSGSEQMANPDAKSGRGGYVNRGNYRGRGGR